MKRTTKGKTKLSSQVKRKVSTPIKKKKEYDGDVGSLISTGSTLLDLAISGGRVRGGGLMSGIFVEIFGPSGAGKTVLLCEIAGEIQRKKGDISFFDPEARLNKQFARIFDLDTDDMDYDKPSTVPELFKQIRNFDPTNNQIVNGVFADSLAALSTHMEMENEEGDKMGMKRAKDFSEQLRKTCRILAQKNLLMVCSNQIRESAATIGPKHKSPGGLAIGFYSSLRLRCFSAEKIYRKRRIRGKEVKKTIGVQTKIEVFKSSVWEPYHTATISILFDYGIDDIRENLQYIKTQTQSTVYSVNGKSLGNKLEDAVSEVEMQGLEPALKEEVIDLWEAIEEKFKIERKPKQR